MTRTHDLDSNTICQTVSYICHSTLKLISDKEDILKLFMAFDITLCGSVFRAIVGSQIVVSQQLVC